MASELETRVDIGDWIHRKAVEKKGQLENSAKPNLLSKTTFVISNVSIPLWSWLAGFKYMLIC